MNRKSVQRFLLKLFVTEDLGSFCGFFSICIYVKQFPTRVKACEADSPSGQKVGESRQWHQPCSQQQFSAKSSTLLTFSSEGSPRQIKRGRGKSQQERETERSWKEKHIAGISHQPWPDFFLLLSSFCPSWLRVELFLKLSSCVCVLCAGSCLPLSSLAWNRWKSAHERDRVRGNVQSESKRLFRIVTPAPLYKANSAYLLCLSKKATPSYCYTNDSLLGFLLHFVGLGVSMHSGSTHSSSPCYVSPSLLPP